MFEDKLHEECGVFGIYSIDGEEVSRDIYFGLTALQHRGQEAAGMAVSDTKGTMGNLVMKKDMGLVSEVFHKDDLERLHGNIGVGHVRYSTTGGSTPENAQPMAMKYIKGSLALVHNGNIINAEELKSEQMHRGMPHYTTSDSEVLAYEIISNRVKAATIEEAIAMSADRLKGGYAVIVMSPRKLVGIRDPYGIKPLVLGKKGNTYILSSESSALTAIGAEFVRDIEPGEIISITKDGIKSLSTDSLVLRPDTTGFVSTKGKWYRGKLLIKNVNGGLTVINDISVEEYIRGVVPSEMSPSWEYEALKAQAIAARSFALANLGKQAKYGYDLKDNTEDQAYNGASGETDKTNRAVNETEGLVLTYDMKIISAYYSASAGGYTNTNAWGGVNLPYLHSVFSFDDNVAKNGHGVGMSQHGANNLAKQGYNAYQILQYFYQNVKFAKLNSEV